MKINKNECNKYGENFWKDILNNDRSLSDEEADEMHRVVSNLRKDKGFY